MRCWGVTPDQYELTAFHTFPQELIPPVTCGGLVVYLFALLNLRTRTEDLEMAGVAERGTTRFKF